MANEDAVKGPHGTPDYQATDSIDPLSGGVAAGALAVTIAKEVLHEYRARVPLACAVVDSAGTGEDRKVTLQLRNQTVHGMYLDAIEVRNAAASHARRHSVGMSLGGSTPPAPGFLPCYLGPSATRDIDVLFSLPDSLLRDTRRGELTITYSRLDEHDPRELTVRFLVREGRPSWQASSDITIGIGD